MSYSSPIKNLCFHSPYEQEFYRIKAHRLQTEVEQIKTQNLIVLTKLRQVSVAQRQVKEENLQLHHELSRTLDESKNHSFQSRVRDQSDNDFASQYNNGSEWASRNSQYRNVETEKLLRQIRILKNDHELEIAGLKEEIRKATRTSTELQADLEKRINNESFLREAEPGQVLRLKEEVLSASNHNQKLQKEKDHALERVLQKDQEIAQLRYELENALEKVKEESEKSIQIQGQNIPYTDSKSLKMILLKQYESVHQERQNYQIQNKRMSELKEQLANKDTTIDQLKREAEKARKSYQQQVQFEVQVAAGKWARENRYLEQKVEHMADEVEEKEKELRDMLAKLKPLLNDKKQKPAASDSLQSRRASLSLLEVLLDKHKIKAFAGER